MNPAKLVKAELGPLIEAAFERHDAVQINHHRSDGQIEEQNGEQPVSGLRGTELRGGADPGCSDHKDDLGQGQIAQSELLFKLRALRKDTFFLLPEVVGRRRSLRHRAFASRYETAPGVET